MPPKEVLMSQAILNETILNRAAEHAAEFLGSLPDRPVAPTVTRQDLLEILDVPLTDGGENGVAVLDALAAAGKDGSMGTAGPRLFGFVKIGRAACRERWEAP